MTERVTFFEIHQPFCTLAYGVGACPAVLGTDSAAKCFNTRATCPVPASFDAGELVLRFAMPQLDLIQYGNVIPCLESLDTAPRTLNLAGMNKSASAMGRAEVVTVRLGDFSHNDHLVDKYRLERASGDAMDDPDEAYDPYLRGTFWGKWMARNPYAVNYACAVRDGELGQALEDMRVRHYVIDSFSGPTNGAVQIVASDLFSRIEKKKSVAPLASQGELNANITAVANNGALSPPGIGAANYPTSGYVQIGDEVMAFTRAGDALTFTARGALGTEATTHEEEDLVQLVYAQEAALAHDIVYDLLVNYSEVPAASIDKTGWDLAAEELTELYTGHVGTPTPVEDLIGELCEQAGFTVFPNVETGMIELIALRPSAPTAVIDDDNALGARTLIVDKSLSVKRQEAKRVSEVWVYYGQINRAEDLDTKRNFRSRVVVVDADPLYDVPVIREVFSRWIPQFGRTFALTVGNRILAQFRDPPWEAQLAIHVDRAADVTLGRPYSLRTSAIQDATGEKLLHAQIVTGLKRKEDQIVVTSEQASFYTAPDDGGVRTIYIDSDARNVNLREVHDQLYVPPVGGSPGEVIHFVLTEGALVGSDSPSLIAMDTGDWPAGVVLSLQLDGTVSGAAGHGGAGGFKGGIRNPTAGSPGGAGGLAFKARFDIEVIGDGTIAGGGGGGGGGGASMPYSVDYVNTGGGGGGGAGDVAGTGGSAYAGNKSGTAGAAGNLSDGGSGGVGGFSGVSSKGGAGGAGGDPGQAGSAGEAGVESLGPGGFAPWVYASGGAGGAAGAAIEGSAFITFTGSPTIIGATS